uniref:Uncharacterized protein n=1 Tax=Trichogramma kaykai TaxID=54128 RepID=A0ABD2WB93_9HYME
MATHNIGVDEHGLLKIRPSVKLRVRIARIVGHQMKRSSDYAERVLAPISNSKLAMPRVPLHGEFNLAGQINAPHSARSIRVHRHSSLQRNECFRIATIFDVVKRDSNVNLGTRNLIVSIDIN